MRFAPPVLLLLVLGCTAHEPNVPEACWDGTSKTPKCVRTYKRVERAFNSKPRWGIWTEPFHYFLVREPGHRFHVQRARSLLARWGHPDAGAHAAADLKRVGVGYKYGALEDLYHLGSLARQWLPEVRAFHQRHKGERWGLDVLALVRMGAPEGPDLLREGLRSGRNPEPYLHGHGSEDIYGEFREELERLHETDPRYGVRMWATFVLRDLTQDDSYLNESIAPPTCFSSYIHNGTNTTLASEDSTFTLESFPLPQTSGGLCDHAPWQGKSWVKHGELLGECVLLYQGNVHPGSVAVYPRDREPYTLFENNQGSTVLNWNGTSWIVTAHSHSMSTTGGMIQVVKDRAGYLRVSEHIDFGGFPLGYKKERDGSLLVLASLGLVFDTPCAEDEASGLQLIRIRSDLTVEPAFKTATRAGLNTTEANDRSN